MKSKLSSLSSVFDENLGPRYEGRVLAVSGLLLSVVGLGGLLRIGQHCLVHGETCTVRGEVVSLDGEQCNILPFGNWSGISKGDRVEALQEVQSLRPHHTWVGRVIDSLGTPLDGRGPLSQGSTSRPLKGNPPPAYERKRVGPRIETGIASLDAFVPLCQGQRTGIFSCPGVGKSTLLARLAKESEVDLVVLGLIGERGREVQDCIQRDLGTIGLARSIVVVSTADEPPLKRRQAAWTATAIAEHFRDEGKHVLLIIDSVTRFAMALREMGLANGEPPAQRGFPPTVFAELPHLVERAGPGKEGQGDITAVYSVLVEGNDLDEPISDNLRGILDGHIILDRTIAESGLYPAVDLLRSSSRMLPGCHTPEENEILSKVRSDLSIYDQMAELIKLGAYSPGANKGIDQSVVTKERLFDFLKDASTKFETTQTVFAKLGDIVGPESTPVSHS